MHITEFCHDRSTTEDGSWCGKPAEFIFWGRLYPMQVLGPRCYDCARFHLQGWQLDERSIEQSAIYKLPNETEKSALLKIAKAFVHQEVYALSNEETDFVKNLMKELDDSEQYENN